MLTFTFLDYCIRGLVSGRWLHDDGGDRAGHWLGLGEGDGPPGDQEEGGPGEPRSLGGVLQEIQVIRDQFSYFHSIPAISYREDTHLHYKKLSNLKIISVHKSSHITKLQIVKYKSDHKQFYVAVEGYM